MAVGEIVLCCCGAIHREIILSRGEMTVGEIVFCCCGTIYGEVVLCRSCGLNCGEMSIGKVVLGGNDL